MNRRDILKIIGLSFFIKFAKIEENFNYIESGDTVSKRCEVLYNKIINLSKQYNVKIITSPKIASIFEYSLYYKSGRIGRIEIFKDYNLPETKILIGDSFINVIW